MNALSSLWRPEITKRYLSSILPTCAMGSGLQVYMSGYIFVSLSRISGCKGLLDVLFWEKVDFSSAFIILDSPFHFKE